MKLSIITINFNDKDGLLKTMESVTHQTFRDFEYIVIDGGSTDGSIDIIKRFADNVDYWVSERDSGIYNAMNKGIERAMGEYCLFLNAGDILEENSVLCRVFEKDFNEDLVYGDLKIVDGEKKKEIIFPDNITFFHMFTSFLPHPSTFIRRECFNFVGNYDERYLIVSDWAFMVRAIGKFNSTTKHIPLIVSNHMFGGVSSRPEHSQKNYDERMRFLKTEFPAFFEDYLEFKNLKDGSTGTNKYGLGKILNKLRNILKNAER